MEKNGRTIEDRKLYLKQRMFFLKKEEQIRFDDHSIARVSNAKEELYSSPNDTAHAPLCTQQWHWKHYHYKFLSWEREEGSNCAPTKKKKASGQPLVKDY
ncbi:hypothetical protein LIER_35740 [Lithospermum erythrorhizon]|uniref:Uncharacterized protein n=1 Tax=Lithospermum erythrorhizon TaxID=34254 RepID=A0AAV3NWC6_LITER